MRDPKTILITGASNGIGAALALTYAEPGRTLLLTGRNAERLAEVAGQCTAAGAVVQTATVDVADRAAMADWLAAMDQAHPIDLVIANAGISGDAAIDDPKNRAERDRLILAVNIDGVLNTVQPLVPRLIARGRGQIAVMSSLAGFRGLPGSAAYSASKAAVRVYGEALRGELAGRGIGVSVICPGFVRSNMTAMNRFPMPFLMDAPRAARIIRRGLARNSPRIAFPRPMYFSVWLLGSVLPPRLTDALLARLPRKDGTSAQQKPKAIPS